MQFHSIYSLPPCTLFSPAINFFSPSHLLNSLAIHFITVALPSLLLKFLSLSTARLSSALIYYIRFNLHPLQILIAAFTSQFWLLIHLLSSPSVNLHRTGNYVYFAWSSRWKPTPSRITCSISSTIGGTSVSQVKGLGALGSHGSRGSPPRDSNISI